MEMDELYDLEGKKVYLKTKVGNWFGELAVGYSEDSRNSRKPKFQVKILKPRDKNTLAIFDPEPIATVDVEDVECARLMPDFTVEILEDEEQ